MGVQWCAPLLVLVIKQLLNVGKKQIKRRLNINQKHSNIDKELILSYKATGQDLSLNETTCIILY